MPVPSMTILYVDNAEQSGAFYARLLDQQPVEASPTFLLFVLTNGLKLGLWSKHTCKACARHDRRRIGTGDCRGRRSRSGRAV